MDRQGGAGGLDHGVGSGHVVKVGVRQQHVRYPQAQVFNHLQDVFRLVARINHRAQLSLFTAYDIAIGLERANRQGLDNHRLLRCTLMAWRLAPLIFNANP
jgi:hypothetical protein